MANLVRTLNARLAQDRKDLARKLEISRDNEVRNTLKLIGRAAGQHKTSVSMFYLAPPDVTITLEDLDSLKNGPVVKVLKRLMDIGVEFNHSSDYPESRNRDFNGRLNRVGVRVACYLKPEATNCRVVVTGQTTETVTRPTYAMICS